MLVCSFARLLAFFLHRLIRWLVALLISCLASVASLLFLLVLLVLLASCVARLVRLTFLVCLACFARLTLFALLALPCSPSALLASCLARLVRLVRLGRLPSRERMDDLGGDLFGGDFWARNWREYFLHSKHDDQRDAQQRTEGGEVEDVYRRHNHNRS